MPKTARDFEHQLKVINNRIKIEKAKRPQWASRREKKAKRLEELNQRLQDETAKYEKFKSAEA